MTQEEALTILKTGANVFLTGEPGSGKTHTINAYIRWLRECGIEPSITAATGIAATHVGGMTLHAWSGIGVLDRLSEAQIDAIAQKEHVARRIQKAKILIIEEVSMLSADTFEAVDAVCRAIRHSQRAFGGLQVVLVGDLFQLPPIARRGSEARFVYDSPVWKSVNPLVCYLAEQHRQGEGDFLEVLSAIRRNEVEEMHFDRLASRRGAPRDTDDIPKLYTHNADVDRINAAELKKLPGAVHKYVMSSAGRQSLIEGLKRGCLSPEILELKEGATVMFTKNSPQGRFVNGTLGKVAGFDAAGLPIVATTAGEQITAEKMEWQVEEGGKVRASITQVPLRLAYAMTVHKSQGMSMDAAIMDLSQAFEYGQGYVALSRVRTLAGLHLLGINRRALEVHPAILEKDLELRLASDGAREAFAQMKSSELAALRSAFVKAMGGAELTARASRADTGNLAGRLAQTLSVVREAATLRAAAKERGLAVSTVVSHLEELQSARHLSRSDFEHLLPDAGALAEIREAIAAVGGEKLTPIFKALKGKYSFESIRLARLVK